MVYLINIISQRRSGRREEQRYWALYLMFIEVSFLWQLYIALNSSVIFNRLVNWNRYQLIKWSQYSEVTKLRFIFMTDCKVVLRIQWDNSLRKWMASRLAHIKHRKLMFIYNVSYWCYCYICSCLTASQLLLVMLFFSWFITLILFCYPNFLQLYNLEL